jgi:hypothetical protein
MSGRAQLRKRSWTRGGPLDRAVSPDRAISAEVINFLTRTVTFSSSEISSAFWQESRSSPPGCGGRSSREQWPPARERLRQALLCGAPHQQEPWQP